MTTTTALYAIAGGLIGALAARALDWLRPTPTTNAELLAQTLDAQAARTPGMVGAADAWRWIGRISLDFNAHTGGFVRFTIQNHDTGQRIRFDLDACDAERLATDLFPVAFNLQTRKATP